MKQKKEKRKKKNREKIKEINNRSTRDRIIKILEHFLNNKKKIIINLKK